MVTKQTRQVKIEAFDFQPGRSIAGKYQVVGLLGKGWEGEVYKIRELSTGIERAAKFFYPERNPGNKTLEAYAKKLHHLRDCKIVIQYFTQELITFKRHQVTVLVSEYVDGPVLSNFVLRFPGKRLPPYMAVHFLYALTSGLESMHLAGSYHGDLHAENVIVQKLGLEFELKLLDLFNWGRASKDNRQEDVCNAIRIFHEITGGQKYYARQPAIVKDICCGLKISLMLKKFPTATALKVHLENTAW